jgi:hypothetical protein
MPPADTQPPTVGGLRAVPSLFAVARAGGGTPRTHRGTHLRFTLSEDSRIKLTIQRIRPGRRHAGKCAPAAARLRHAARCSLYRTVGTLTRAGKRGANTVAFTGRIARRTLMRGGYRVVLRAVDAAGNQSVPHAARFRIIAG